MELRDARPSDAEAIRTIHRTAIEVLGGQAYGQDQVEAWATGTESADYTTTIAAEDSAMIVGEIDGAIVGFGSLNLGSPTGYHADVDAEITGVYVHPEHSRRGVGTRLCRELERRARERDAEVLGLQASLNAVQFYRANGYERVRELEHEFSSHADTGSTGTVVEMKKRLGPIPP